MIYIYTIISFIKYVIYNIKVNNMFNIFKQKINFERYKQENEKEEEIRDFTSLANPTILSILVFLFLGVNTQSITFVILIWSIEFFGSIFKLVFFKPRPNAEKYTNWKEKIRAGAFPSLHTSRATFVFVTLFFIYDTGSLSNYIFLALVAIIGYTRIALRKHDIIDTLGGLILGLIYSYLYINFLF